MAVFVLLSHTTINHRWISMIGHTLVQFMVIFINVLHPFSCRKHHNVNSNLLGTVAWSEDPVGRTWVLHLFNVRNIWQYVGRSHQLQTNVLCYRWQQWIGGVTAFGFEDRHDDVIKWKLFPRYWPFVRGIHRSPVNSPHKGQWRGAFMFSLICIWMNGWINNRDACDLRRYRAHYDVIVMVWTDAI